MNRNELLNHMNDNLKKGSTLTLIAGEILISRKTIAKRLNEIGYKYDMSAKRFIKYRDITDILEVAVTTSTKPKHKSNTNVFQNKDAQNKMLDIIDKHSNITEMLEWFNKERNVVEVDISELKIDRDKLQGETKVTTIRVYVEVWERFQAFIRENKEFKSMDLISMSMVEYMDRYNR